MIPATSPDQIPIKFIKAVTEIIGGLSIHLFNTLIEISSFPDAWKIARITLIPKNESTVSESDMRPISILLVLSKIFERLVHQHSKITYQALGKATQQLPRIRVDIIKAMKRRGVTLMILAYFSKAFDTIKYKIVLNKLNSLGF